MKEVDLKGQGLVRRTGLVSMAGSEEGYIESWQKDEMRAQIQGKRDPQNKEKEDVCKERAKEKTEGQESIKGRKRPKDESKKAMRWLMRTSRNG